MSEQGSREVEGIDADGVTGWFTDHAPEVDPPLHFDLIAGGHSNLTYRVTDQSDRRWVLRRPPLGHVLATAHDMGREHRIIAALGPTDVPVPPVVGLCTDDTVNGAPFYVMGFVDGWSPMGLATAADGSRPWPAPFDTDLDAREDLAYQLVEGIALLGNVDWRAKGLDDLGRPDGFHERQVDRWTAFLERIKGRELPGFDEASAWLRAHKPIDFVPGLMHGDYQFANVMFDHGSPARLAAIVDWEMGTIGDPKLDLGWVLQGWPEDTSAPETFGNQYVDMTGMPNRAQVLAHYAAISGRQVDDIDYYLVLARWKLAVVLEQGFQRAGGNPTLEAFGPVVLDLMEGAAELAETSDYRGPPT